MLKCNDALRCVDAFCKLQNPASELVRKAVLAVSASFRCAVSDELVGHFIVHIFAVDRFFNFHHIVRE